MTRLQAPCGQDVGHVGLCLREQVRVWLKRMSVLRWSHWLPCTRLLEPWRVLCRSSYAMEVSSCRSGWELLLDETCQCSRHLVLKVQHPMQEDSHESCTHLGT